jgi:hypothetical protein
MRDCIDDILRADVMNLYPDALAAIKNFNQVFRHVNWVPDVLIQARCIDSSSNRAIQKLGQEYPVTTS